MSECHVVYLCVSGVGISLFNKAVGDSVELPSGLERECIKSMEWKYKEMVIAEFDGNVSLPKSQFEGRLEMNDSNLSLIIRELSLQDSGEFLVSAASNKGHQIPTKTIHLQVHGRLLCVIPSFYLVLSFSGRYGPFRIIISPSLSLIFSLCFALSRSCSLSRLLSLSRIGWHLKCRCCVVLLNHMEWSVYGVGH